MVLRLERVTERAAAHLGYQRFAAFSASALASAATFSARSARHWISFWTPIVVLREFVGLADAAHLELHARPQRAFLRPLLGFFLRRHVEDPETVEQLLGLGV